MSKEQIEQAAREYCGCEDCPSCNTCEWMSDEDEQLACTNFCEYEAFNEGAQSRQPEIDDLASKLNQALILIEGYRMLNIKLLKLKE